MIFVSSGLSVLGGCKAQGAERAGFWILLVPCEPFSPAGRKKGGQRMDRGAIKSIYTVLNLGLVYKYPKLSASNFKNEFRDRYGFAIILIGGDLLGSVIKKRRKKMRKHKHRKLLARTRHQRRKGK
jgi:hypothetical protein